MPESLTESSSESSSESFFDEIIRYVGFDERDRVALRAFHAHAEPHFEAIADEFYDRLSRHQEAAKVLSGSEQIVRLKFTLRQWLDSLLRGPWDQAYYERRARIGRMHVRIRLPQRYMFTAMNVIRTHLLETAERAYGGSPAQLSEASRALGRILDLELAIMLETYREDSHAEIRRFARLQRKKLEDRLALSEARYQAVVENAQVMVLVVDREGKIVLLNRTAEGATGYHRDELIGERTFYQLCQPDYHDLVRLAVGQALAGEPSSAFETLINTIDDDQRRVRWHVTPLPSPEGPMACAIGVDVTEEHALAARTRRAERLASLGTLAAGLAHEIRNPLNAAQLQLMLVERRLGKLEDSEISAKARDAAHVVREELHRLAVLVGDFLAFARPSALRLVAADLSDTVRDVIELMAPEAEAASVTLTSDVESHVATRFDQERMKQVLINLIRNAIEAASGGAVDVRCIRMRRTALIEVRDTGPGLPSGIDVFEPFATTKEGGTGLGLPIVHRIITDHDGYINVERRGDLTVFVIEIPLDGPADDRDGKHPARM